MLILLKGYWNMMVSRLRFAIAFIIFGLFFPNSSYFEGGLKRSTTSGWVMLRLVAIALDEAFFSDNGGLLLEFLF